MVEALGYALDRTRGSHHMDYHDKVPEFLNIQPDKNGMAKPYQVRESLRDVDDFGLIRNPGDHRDLRGRGAGAEAPQTPR